MKLVSWTMTGPSFFLLSIQLGSLALATAAPSSTVVSYLSAIWDIPFASMAASAVAVNPEATTYEVLCLSGAPTTDCRWTTLPITLIAGPTTVHFKVPVSTSTLVQDVSVMARGLMTMACDFPQPKTITCTMTAELTASPRGVTSSFSSRSLVGTIASDRVSYEPLTVTGGLEKFQTSATPATMTAAASNLVEQVMATRMPVGAVVAAARQDPL
ncbi:hypothetical protein N7539_007449 [Penicillium diatomitis]|uniref:Uncharacterized protein n=1 Tax=Penicillium diatomitis TaxID=2819901 RepID=A0A9X0BNX3_9EURO|nr:uncharacterized protein N7539_007449 [Penicillium diatomitis]KAJ5477305.1 hypothetical protein N7539_007449 [Penicillium diatomitis]